MAGDPSTTTAITPVEPGYTTTEFWATQVTSLFLAVLLVLTVFGTIHLSDQQKSALEGLLTVAIGTVQGLYAIARGLRKQGQ